MERAELASGKKTGRAKIKHRRLPGNKAERKRKAEKLVCRSCGSDDLAPSFIKRRDRRCRKCFSKRYRSAEPAKKQRSKEEY
jgi:ribosomal protein L40E